MRAKVVPVFCLNGQIRNATVFSYKCNNKNSKCNLDAYPNFYTCNQSSSKQNQRDDSYRVTYQSLIKDSKFIYLGGDYAFERLVLDNMSNLLQYVKIILLNLKQ